MIPGGVLYQNADKNIWVVDIPASIAEAQASGDQRLRLISCSAVDKPWPNNEPKSDKAKAGLRAQQPDDQDVQAAVLNALAAVGREHQGAYCLARTVQAAFVPTGAKRTRADSSPTRAADSLQPLYIKNVLSKDAADKVHVIVSTNATPYLDSPTELAGQMVCNASSSTAKLLLQDKLITCRIPPQASFFLGDCSSSMSFHRAVRELARKQQTKSQFDVTIMDPPWPSASVRRGAQKGQAHYNVTRSLWDMRQLLFDMDIGPLLAEQGLLAVWITNKPAVRDLILSHDDGLFESCGVQLIEECVWVKVTSGGEPVLPMDGLWRKPYEILLIGRKKAVAGGNEAKKKGMEAQSEGITRRVVFAVPDLHSRKPCLKHVIASIFDLDTDQRGLEIFARNLVSGWHAWGNEVLKFSDEACWTVTRECTPEREARQGL